jgi:3-hydroxyacyl-[acyl-carrier-protein] dehydratase
MSAGLTPHGPGFSFIDTFAVTEPGKAGRAGKRLDPDLWFFRDHFPGNPLMPGVLLIESAAQAAGALWGAVRGEAKRSYVLAQVEGFRFKQPVMPGADLVIDVVLEKDFGTLAKFRAEISVNSAIVACGQVTLSAAP